MNRDYKPPKQTQRVNITSRGAQLKKKTEGEKKRTIGEYVYIKNQHQRTTKNQKQKQKTKNKKQKEKVRNKREKRKSRLIS